MSPSGLRIVHVPGGAGDAGFAHGRLLRPMLAAVRERYVADMMRLNRVDAPSLSAQAERWLAGLPLQYQAEIEAMAAGAGPEGGGLRGVTEFLYADIAQPQTGAGDGEDQRGEAMNTMGGSVGGPMCSGFVAPVDGSPWVARNCDWYRATLQRGCSAVVHETPGRIPCLAVGLHGDIDVDTGLNAERLWLHVHTLYARDAVRGGGVPVISWLFAVRELLETCATVADVERGLAAADRDRGIMLFAVDGKSGEAAVFECGRSSVRRIDPAPARVLGAGAGEDDDPGVPGMLLGTNHCRGQGLRALGAGGPAGETRLVGRASSTSNRYRRLRELLLTAPPERGPDDLTEILADGRVEMRDPPTLTTIYAAVCDPRGGRVWFAHADEDGRSPASSTGAWGEVGWRF